MCFYADVLALARVAYLSYLGVRHGGRKFVFAPYDSSHVEIPVIRATYVKNYTHCNVKRTKSDNQPGMCVAAGRLR